MDSYAWVTQAICAPSLVVFGFSPEERTRLRRQTAASVTSSFISTTVLTPVAVVKVRFQSDASQRIAAIIRDVHRQRGLLGFWAGWSTGLIQSVPSLLVFMLVYENSNAYLKNRVGNYSPVVSSSLARAMSLTLVAPLELIRTNESGGTVGSRLEIASSILRTEGLRGLYRGWSSSLLRDVPFSAIYWQCYETIKSSILRYDSSGYFSKRVANKLGPGDVTAISVPGTFLAGTFIVSVANLTPSKAAAPPSRPLCSPNPLMWSRRTGKWRGTRRLSGRRAP